MNDLIRTLEEAKQGHATLDSLLAAAAGDYGDPAIALPRMRKVLSKWRDSEALVTLLIEEFGFVAQYCPRSQSVDAALTLVPEAFSWCVSSSRQFPGHAFLYPPDNVDYIEYHGQATTPALALGIAALKARAAATHPQESR